MSNTPPRPLPDRIRPQSLDDFVGQTHLVGEGRPLRKMIAVSYTHLTLPTNREV